MLGAVLMVIVAIFVRGLIDGDDDPGGGGSSDGGDGEPGISLVCADELADVCDDLLDAGEIEGFDAEPAGDTVDRLAEEGAELEADAWLTLDPFPGIADIARGEANLGAIFDEALGVGFATPVGIAVQPARVDAVTAACDDEVDWPCLGELVGDEWADHGGEATWGSIEVGLEDPTSATGLLTAAQAVAGHLDLPTFATNDLDGSDANRWISRFEDGADVLTQMVLQAGSFDAVGALGQAAEDLAASARGRGMGIFYPAPMFEAEVVLVAPAGSADGLVDGDALTDALADQGWGEGASSPLPSPGALYALREQL